MALGQGWKTRRKLRDECVVGTMCAVRVKHVLLGGFSKAVAGLGIEGRVECAGWVVGRVVVGGALSCRRRA